MSMDNYPQNADTVEESFVEKTCPFLFGALSQSCISAGTTLDDVSDCLDESRGMDSIDGVTEEEEKEIRSLYEQLQTKFKEYTGLDLYICYHNAEDRGDEVDGTFWTVDGVWMKTPAGEKYNDKITPKVWNVFG